MTTNSYFNHLTVTSEQNFVEDLIVENIQTAGMDVYYMPREFLEIDPILGEPLKSSFNQAHIIEVYFQNVQGYGGEGDLMSKFGFQMKDTATFIMSKKRFEAINVPGRTRPREGDLLYVGTGYGTFTNSFFEINFVEHESPNWQLGKYFVYELRCALTTFSYETVNTGIPAIDSNDLSNTSELNVAVNAALTTKKSVLVDFSEKNPFGEF